MQIWHRVSFGKTDAVDAQLEALNIRYKKTLGLHGNYLITFEINESDPRWPQVSELVRRTGAPDLLNTVFTQEEILGADRLRLIPRFEQGYPQPKESWITNPINYDNFCRQCGTFRQKTSFRVKKEPSLGKKDFMTLYWTYALFSTTRVLGEFEAQRTRGYEVWPLVIHKTNTPSEEVSQLFIPTIMSPGLMKAEDLKKQTCPECHVTKYYPHMRGVMYLKRDSLVPDVDLMQTHEWFGDGHFAYREILVSNKLARLVIDKGWQGVTFKVVELL